MFDTTYFKEKNDKYIKDVLEGWDYFYQRDYPDGFWGDRKKNAILFIDKILEVYKNDRQIIYNTFQYFYSENAFEFLDKLSSFVSNFFFDDSYFSIKFYEVRRSEDTSSGVEEYEVEPWKDYSFSELVEDDNGTQDPTALLKLLDWIVAQKVLSEERFEKIIKGRKGGS